LLILLCFAFSFTKPFINTSKANTHDSLPSIPYQPTMKNGWVGQYVFRVQFRGKGNRPAPHRYDVSFNHIHTSYAELSREIRYPIRVNQPDKNNNSRWESWIAEGKKKSWNYIADTIKEVTVITSDKCCRTPHNFIYYATAGSSAHLKLGDASSIDLQIDWQTGTWILSLPGFAVKTAVYEKWNVYDKKLQVNNYIRIKEENYEPEIGLEYEKFFPKLRDTLQGFIKPGQKVLEIKRTFPVTYKSYLWDNREEVYITPFSKGVIEFELILCRINN